MRRGRGREPRIGVRNVAWNASSSDRGGRGKAADSASGERIGNLSFCNIRLRAGHSHRLSGAISNGKAAAEHPAECAVFVPDAMDAFKVRSVPVLVRGDFIEHALAVISMDAIKPLLWLVTHFVFGVTDHRLPAV